VLQRAARVVVGVDDRETDDTLHCGGFLDFSADLVSRSDQWIALTGFSRQ